MVEQHQREEEARIRKEENIAVMEQLFMNLLQS